MLLNSVDRDVVVDALRCGARGIFTRAQPINVLPECICAVHHGQVWLSNQQIELLLELVSRLRPLQVVRPGGMALLSSRERQVLGLVAEGMRNREISEKLNLTEHTVRNYLCRISEKLGLSSRVELVLYALSR
jgi:DNA-binding NarL/FixJ family response regulator